MGDRSPGREVAVSRQAVLSVHTHQLQRRLGRLRVRLAYRGPRHRRPEGGEDPSLTSSPDLLGRGECPLDRQPKGTEGPVSVVRAGILLRQRTTGLGHEHAFPPHPPNAGCAIRKETVA